MRDQHHWPRFRLSISFDTDISLGCCTTRCIACCTRTSYTRRRYEARKFLPHWPHLADRNRQSEDVEQVASISTGLAEFIRRECLWTHGLTRRWTGYCTPSSA